MDSTTVGLTHPLLHISAASHFMLNKFKLTKPNLM